MPQSKLSPLSIPLTTLVLLLSWVFAFLPPVLVSLIVTHADRSLSWYCRPYLGAMLYGIPALMGLMLVHCLLRMLYISKVIIKLIWVHFINLSANKYKWMQSSKWTIYVTYWFSISYSDCLLLQYFSGLKQHLCTLTLKDCRLVNVASLLDWLIVNELFLLLSLLT